MIEFVTPPAYTGRMTPRRSPDPEARRRDSERARERLLDAAVEEFGAKGFAGARVRQIAARAGLNQQLVSYYFGGKAGLYAALQRRWRETSADLSRPGVPLEDVVLNFLHTSMANRSWAKLLAWQGLTDDEADQAEDNANLMQGMVAYVRQRQAAGDLAADLEPAHVALALFAAAAAPTLLPHVARQVSGLDPASDAFARAYGEQLMRLVRHLKRPVS